MEKSKRKARDTEEFEEPGLLLEPFDVTKLGTDEDPCFGKLYDLKAEECQMCGDIEVCAIAFSQKMSVERLSIESQGQFKDLDEVKYVAGADHYTNDKELETFVVTEILKGTPRIKIIRIAQEKFNADRDKIKSFFK